jgi:hypothetical protein
MHKFTIVESEFADRLFSSQQSAQVSSMQIIGRLQEEHRQKIEDLEIALDETRALLLQSEMSASFAQDAVLCAAAAPDSSFHENAFFSDMKTLQAEFECARMRIAQLEYDQTHSQSLVNAFVILFKVLRRSLRTKEDIYSVLDLIDYGNAESLTRCSQQLESQQSEHVSVFIPADSNSAFATDFSVEFIDRSRSCSECMWFNASFVRSCCTSAANHGLGCIRRLFATSALGSLYSRLDSRAHLTDDERNV